MSIWDGSSFSSAGEAAPDVAAAAKLFIAAAGDPAAVDACQPLFDALGQKTTVIGTEPSGANLVKLSGNFLLASAIEALGEAVALVGKAGIDPTVAARGLWLEMHPLHTARKKIGRETPTAQAKIDTDQNNAKPDRPVSKISSKYKTKPIIVARPQ